MASNPLKLRLTRRSGRALAIWCVLLAVMLPTSLAGAGQGPRTGQTRPSPVPAAQDVSSDYVIGPTDVLGIVFWGDRDLTSDVTVRPDGKISLPLLNDVVAAGSTPDQLRLRLTEEAKRYVQAPVVTVVVRQVNNNRAFITGQIAHPGPYVLAGPTTVLQLIATAGGFTEFADRKHVLITRIQNGNQVSFAFSYDDVIKRRALGQNILLKAGDTVVVP
jgi:polysaccharide export outer membrane protein